jgi:hypothetical protein
MLRLGVDAVKRTANTPRVMVRVGTDSSGEGVPLTLAQ